MADTNMQEQIVALEKRAAAAEATLSKLSKTNTGADNSAVLGRLVELQKLIGEDKIEAETVRAQRDELQKENEELKTDVTKLNYRIKHLLRTIEELEATKA